MLIIRPKRGKKDFQGVCKLIKERIKKLRFGLKMCDIVKSLLNKPFSHHTYEEKLLIVENGRPKPVLNDLKCEHREKSRVYMRSFNTNHYEKYVWLTGSGELNKLYCWPCLLFSSEENPWSSSGFSNLNYVVTACDKHQKSVAHLRAFSALQSFGFQRIDHALNEQKRIADSLHNKKVTENRLILRRLIDTVSFLGKQGCPFTGYDEGEYSNNRGMYIELLKLLANYDPLLANHLKTSTDFKGTSPLIQDDIINAVASVVSDKIKLEIRHAPFVAIMLDEITDVSNQSQLSTVIRYVDDDGNCQERFLHFSDVSSDRTAQGLFEHVTGVVDDLDCGENLVAQTFDGAAVLSGHVSGLQKLLRDKYPSAYFIHCYSQKLNLVLSKSTICIKQCRQFFISLASIPNFFSHSTNRTNALKDFTLKKLPVLPPIRWNFSSRLVNTLLMYRQLLIEFFLSIEDEPDSWTPEEVNAASGFIHFLTKCETKFFLVVFNRIFSFSDKLYDALHNRSMDLVYCNNKVAEFSQTLQKIRNLDFEELWGEAEYLDTIQNDFKPMRQALDKEQFKSIFYEILDTLLLQMKLRFEAQKDLTFVSLLDCDKFSSFSRCFPDYIFSQLKEPYVHFFDTVRLKNELKVVYALEEYANKSVKEICSYIKLNKLHVVFTEVYKLAQLILTFPLTVERSFSALRRIKTYLRATQGQIRRSNLALLSVEKDILVLMKEKSPEEFYDAVCKKFTEKSKRMEFMYK